MQSIAAPLQQYYARIALPLIDDDNSARVRTVQLVLNLAKRGVATRSADEQSPCAQHLMQVALHHGCYEFTA